MHSGYTHDPIRGHRGECARGSPAHRAPSDGAQPPGCEPNRLRSQVQIREDQLLKDVTAAPSAGNWARTWPRPGPAPGAAPRRPSLLADEDQRDRQQGSGRKMVPKMYRIQDSGRGLSRRSVFAFLRANPATESLGRRARMVFYRFTEKRWRSRFQTNPKATQPRAPSARHRLDPLRSRFSLAKLVWWEVCPKATVMEAT